MSTGTGSEPGSERSGMRCQMCGEMNPPQARYCLSCGTRLLVTTTPDADAAAFEDALESVIVDDAPAASSASDPWNATAATSSPGWTPPPPDTTATSGVYGPPPPVQSTSPTQPTAPPLPTGSWSTTPGAVGTSPSPPVAAPPPTEGWSAGNPTAAASGWPTPADVRQPRRWPWIVLIIVGGLVFCCCSLFSVGIIANQTGSIDEPPPLVQPYA